MNDLEIILVRREIYYHEIEYVRSLENLAAAILLFHKGEQWTANNQQMWEALTGRTDVTTKALCDYAREIQSKANCES